MNLPSQSVGTLTFPTSALFLQLAKSRLDRSRTPDVIGAGDCLCLLLYNSSAFSIVLSTPQFLMNTTSVEEANRVIEGLPLKQAKLLRFDLISPRPVGSVACASRRQPNAHGVRFRAPCGVIQVLVVKRVCPVDGLGNQFRPGIVFRLKTRKYRVPPRAATN